MWCQVSTITKRSTEASGSSGIVGVREDGDDVANAGIAQPAVEVPDHVRAHVHRVDAARVAHGAGEAEREVPRARADVGHHLALAQREGLQHLVRLLVRVPRRVVEGRDVRHRVPVEVVHLLLGRGGLGEGAGAKRNGATSRTAADRPARLHG